MPHPALNLCVHLAEPSLAVGAAGWILCPKSATISTAVGCDQGPKIFMSILVVFMKAVICVRCPDRLKLMVGSTFMCSYMFTDISTYIPCVGVDQHVLHGSVQWCFAEAPPVVVERPLSDPGHL